MIVFSLFFSLLRKVLLSASFIRCILDYTIISVHTLIHIFSVVVQVIALITILLLCIVGVVFIHIFLVAARLRQVK